jgi:hypothetical protein
MLTIPSHKGNANQNHTKIHLTAVRVAIIKTPPTTSVDEDVGKKGSLIQCWWESKQVQPL